MQATRHLRSIRLLAECYQGFERASGRRVRQFDLTPSQFDIIATLGNTTGMSCKELVERTLMTKGTMTGVIDRLVKRGLVDRQINCDDRRSIFVRLTAAGQQEFERTFPQQIASTSQAFSGYSHEDFTRLEHELLRLRHVIQSLDMHAPNESSANTSSQIDILTYPLSGENP